MDSGDALVKALVDRFPGLNPIYREHLNDNNQVLLPHVLFWNLTRAAVDSFLGQEPHLDWLDLVTTLDDEYEGGDSYVRGIVEASFLENLPYPGERGYEIVKSLPNGLRAGFCRLRPAG